MFDIDWMAGMSAGVFTLQNSDVKQVMTGAREDRGRPQHEPAHRHPQDRPDRADERAPGGHAAAARTSTRSRSGSTASTSGGETAAACSSTSTTCRTRAPSAWRRSCSRRSPGRVDAAGSRVRAHARAGHAGRPDRQPAAVPGADLAACRSRNPGTPPAARPWSTRPPAGGAGQGTRHRAQPAGGGRQGRQHAAHRRHGGRVLDHRGGAASKLDVPQRQVVIDVTIAEVTLTDELDFGVEWLFKGGAPSGRGSGGLADRQHHRRQSLNPAPRTLPAATRHARRRAGQGLHVHHQQRELPGRHPGGAAPARHLRQHQDRRQSARRGARQPEGHHQVRRPHPDQPADAGRRHHQRRHHHVAVHRHRRAAAGDAAHQRRRAGGARRAGRGQRSRATRVVDG